MRGQQSGHGPAGDAAVKLMLAKSVSTIPRCLSESAEPDDAAGEVEQVLVETGSAFVADGAKAGSRQPRNGWPAVSGLRPGAWPLRLSFGADLRLPFRPTPLLPPGTGVRSMSTTVIQHVLNRLKEIGVGHVFGVPGDYAFPVNDAICHHPDIKWIGCCNELNAAYAADGYARVHGVGALSTTYGVGELSAINGWPAPTPSTCPCSIWSGCRPCRSRRITRLSTTRWATGSSTSSRSCRRRWCAPVRS